MKLRCKANSGRALIKSNIKPEGYYTLKTKFYITVDREYVVYAISTINNTTWFAITDDDYYAGSYPMWKPAELFEIVEHKIPREFIFGVYTNGGEDMSVRPIISFPEWVNDREFYTKLVDGDKKTLEVFEKHKHVLDLEHDKYIDWEPLKIKKNLYAGDSVIDALEIYDIENCSYPEKLSELIPGYMAALPLPTVENKHWIYSVGKEKGYFFGFSIEEKGKEFIIYRTDKERKWQKIIA
jgi:hypothetical protein